MALITCPECKREVSSFAKTCPNCGCPVSEMSAPGIVRIKMPNLQLGWAGLFSSRTATITDANGRTLWSGQHGENAQFEISEPQTVTISLGGWANEFSGTVEPRRKYTCVQDMGVHMLATFRLSEVDIIDAD